MNEITVTDPDEHLGLPGRIYSKPPPPWVERKAFKFLHFQIGLQASIHPGMHFGMGDLGLEVLDLFAMARS